MPGIRYNMLCNFNTYILYIKLSNMQIQKSSSLGTGDARWMDGWMDVCMGVFTERWMDGSMLNMISWIGLVLYICPDSL